VRVSLDVLGHLPIKNKGWKSAAHKEDIANENLEKERISDMVWGWNR
jgi:hypothetical protein